MALPALLLAAAISAPSDAAAAMPATARPALPVAPTIHALQRSPAKSGAPEANKPALPPRRHGPVLKLQASLGADGSPQLHCENDGNPSSVSDGDQP
ncbi:MAG: hypothetical protein R3F12_11970 [Lysobacteraceae bacterium]|nr:hypothetical protein [Xanthomonadaceae bacterium]